MYLIGQMSCDQYLIKDVQGWGNRMIVLRMATKGPQLVIFVYNFHGGREFVWGEGPMQGTPLPYVYIPVIRFAGKSKSSSTIS